MLLQLLHKKSTSKNYSFLYVEEQDDKKRRFTIMWERDSARLLGEKRALLDMLHVGDIFKLLLENEEEKKKLVWRRSDFLALKVDSKAEIVERYNLSHPFVPIPPPPKGEERDVAKEYCKHWINARQCPFALDHSTKCPRLHPEGDELKRIRDEWVAEKRARRKQLGQSPDDHHVEKTSRSSKASVFADFLFKAFQLTPESSLLDIAGGRGTISIELFIRHSIKSVLVDPRDDCLRGLKYQEIALRDTSDRKYSHMKEWFTMDFFNLHPNLLTSTSLIFGMHPDQATELIVDLALHHHLPFAIVPCCVFANENSTRRLKSGKQVVLYEDFILYLREKSEEIKQVFLPFEGKNICLYKI